MSFDAPNAVSAACDALPHRHPYAERLQLAPTLVLAALILLVEYGLLQFMDLGSTPRGKS